MSANLNALSSETEQGLPSESQNIPSVPTPSPSPSTQASLSSTFSSQSPEAPSLEEEGKEEREGEEHGDNDDDEDRHVLAIAQPHIYTSEMPPTTLKKPLPLPSMPPHVFIPQGMVQCSSKTYENSHLGQNEMEPHSESVVEGQSPVLIPEGTPLPPSFPPSPQTQEQKPFPIPNDYHPRPSIVSNLTASLMKYSAVMVRGTPACGKTILGKLVYNYVVRNLPDYTCIHLYWERQEDGNARGDMAWHEYLVRGHGIDSAEIEKKVNVIFIIDDAHLAFNNYDNGLWNVVKNAKSNGVAAKFLLLASYMNASNIVPIYGSASCDLVGPHHVPLFPGRHEDIAIAFTKEEISDLVGLGVSLGEHYHLQTLITDALWKVANGHVGLTKAIIEHIGSTNFAVLPASVVDSKVNALFGTLFNGLNGITDVVMNTIARTIPFPYIMQPENEKMRQALTHAIVHRCILAPTITQNTHIGLRKAFGTGFLYAAFVEGNTGKTCFVFPSELHRMIIAHMLRPHRNFLPQYDSVHSPRDLALAAIKNLSISQMSTFSIMCRYGIPGCTKSGSYFAFELYRCLHFFTGAVPCTEFQVNREGAMDMYFPEKRWAIRAIFEDDNVKWNTAVDVQPIPDSQIWRDVDDYVVFDFRQVRDLNVPRAFPVDDQRCFTVQFHKNNPDAPDKVHCLVQGADGQAYADFMLMD